MYQGLDPPEIPPWTHQRNTEKVILLLNFNHKHKGIHVILAHLPRLKPKDEPEKEKFELLQKDLRRRHAQLNEMEESLPKKSGTYLKIILGSVNVSFLNKQER